MITLQAITANGVPIAACPAAKLTKTRKLFYLSCLSIAVVADV